MEDKEYEEYFRNRESAFTFIERGFINFNIKNKGITDYNTCNEFLAKKLYETNLLKIHFPKPIEKPKEVSITKKVDEYLTTKSIAAFKDILEQFKEKPYSEVSKDLPSFLRI